MEEKENTVREKRGERTGGKIYEYDKQEMSEIMNVLPFRMPFWFRLRNSTKCSICSDIIVRYDFLLHPDGNAPIPF